MARRGADSAGSASGQRIRVAFLGPKGTFTEEALFASRESDEVEPIPEPTVYDCVIAVQEGRVDQAIVPIENSLEGSVSATLDALAFETDKVTIIGEVVHSIQHCLIARSALPLEDIERVLSHPQASAQCSRFIRSRLPGVVVEPTSSTADAVRLLSESDRPWAALGNRLAAELYGCVILETGVEDTADNETRFVWLASGAAPDSQANAWKTSVVFWGIPDAPGSLVGILEQFADRGVNLTKIESRPRKQGLGRYIFFADLEGRQHDQPIVSALGAVGAKVETLRVLGSYPAAAK